MIMLTVTYILTPTAAYNEHHVYNEPHLPNRALVCNDESAPQMIQAPHTTTPNYLLHQFINSFYYENYSVHKNRCT